MKDAKESDQEKDTHKDENPMQKLEEALLLCKFGRFNALLMIAAMCAMFVCIAITTTASNILPSAECDLDMNIIEKGVLNSMPFIGQICSGVFIGFITDALGRRKFLIGGNLVVFVCMFLQGAAQTYWVLVVGKLIEGIFLNICFNVASVMVSECTHKNVRDQVLVVWSSFMAIGFIVVGLISWLVLPRQWDVVFLDGFFRLHSWNFYLYICSIFCLVAAVLYYYLPESPKYLLSCGREEDALNVLKRIYTMNSGEDKDSFPVTSLMVSKTIVPENKTSLKKQLVVTLVEVKNLFRQPLLSRLSLMMFLNFTGLFATACFRFWYPQISTIIESYQKEKGDSGMFCEIIDDYMNSINLTLSNNTEPEICTPRLFGFETYSLGIFMGSISLMIYICNAYLVNIVGQKPLMFILLFPCAFLSGAIYWMKSLMIISILFSATCALIQAALALLYNIIMRVFPTSLRAQAFTLVMIAGRIGSFMGSLLFPLILKASCIGPFIYLFTSSLFIAALVYFLPNPAKENTNGDT